MMAGGAGMMAMMPFTVEAAGLGVDSVSVDRLRWLIDKMKKKGACLCPTLHVFEQMGDEPPEGVPPEAWEVQKKVISGMREVGAFFTSEMAKNGVRLLVGQDGSSPEGAFAEMEHLKACGLSEQEIIRGATIYPAEWLGVEGRLGSISPGKQARILVLDRNPLEGIENIKTAFLVINGNQILPKDPSNWGYVGK